MSQRTRAIDIEAFDTFVETQVDTAECELIDGVIVMMTNPTETHEQIAGNIGAPLKLAMDARQCRTYQGGMWVQRPDDPRDTDKTRPDVVVRCGPVAARTFITDPLVVVEVLSPSTASIDRRERRLVYLAIPTLQHYLIVDPAGVVDIYTPEGTHQILGPGDQIALACANTLLLVDELFE